MLIEEDMKNIYGDEIKIAMVAIQKVMELKERLAPGHRLRSGLTASREKSVREVG